MNLQKKIFTGYGVAVVLLGVVIAWAVGHIIAISQSSDAIIHENHKSILAAENMIEALERQEHAVLMTFFDPVENGLKQFRKNEMAFLKWLTRAKDNVYVPGESELLKTIETRYSDYIHHISHFLELAQTANPSFEARKRLYRQSIAPVANQIREKCMKLSDLNEDIMYKNNLETSRMADRAVWSTAAVAGLGLFAVLVFSFVLSRRMTNPLQRLMAALQQVTSGNYAVSVPVETTDELGKLAIEFNKMASRLDEYNQLNIGRIIAEKQKGDAILDNIADGLLVFDGDLHITDINPAACDIIGKPAERCLSRPCWESIPNEKICQSLQHVANEGQVCAADEDDYIVEIENPVGKKHFSFSISLIRDQSGTISGFVLMLKDVTRFKELEQLKTEFVMAASHELRTPLAGMSMSLDLLVNNASDRLDERQLELLRGANDELKRLKSLVNDLLELSKIESGRIEMDLAPIPIRPAVEHVNTAFQPNIESKGVRLAIDVDEDLPFVCADIEKITWVLTNLVSNAIRYAPQEHGWIHIFGKQIGKFVHIGVADNGPGIPEQYHSKIFQKFAQVEGYESGGAGLGLSISREIIRAHGGTIWVDSKPGAGATFTLTLPTVH